MRKPTDQIAVVTGGNRGLGYETCRLLARQGIQVILTARSEEKGRDAARRLSGDGFSVIFHRLDVTLEEQARELVRFIEVEFKGRLDILVNNAGIMIDSEDRDWDMRKVSALKVSPERVRRTFEANVLGPYILCQQLIPLMQKGGYGRVVNVSSGMGQLSEMGGGWPGYRLSKTALNALTCLLAAELKGTGILVNSASPGWARTDMGGPEAEISAEEGADTIAWLATLPEDGPSGGFFEGREPMEW